MATQPRRRLQFKFWLDENKPDEKWLTEVCYWLMEQKKFVSSVRDGLRLIFDLRYQRSTDSLVEMFPDIRQMLEVKQPAPPPISGGGELQEIKNMLEIALAQVKDDNRLVMNGTIPMGTGTALKAPTLAMPTFDDDEDTMPFIPIAKNDDQSANDNFLKSLSVLH